MQYMGKYGTKTSSLASGIDARLLVAGLVLGGLLLAGLLVLMFMDVPVSSQPIEKELDAKAFLESK